MQATRQWPATPHVTPRAPITAKLAPRYEKQMCRSPRSAGYAPSRRRRGRRPRGSQLGWDRPKRQAFECTTKNAALAAFPAVTPSRGWAQEGGGLGRRRRATSGRCGVGREQPGIRSLPAPSRPARDVKNVRQIEAHSERWSPLHTCLRRGLSPAGGTGWDGDNAMRVTASVGRRGSGNIRLPRHGVR